MFVITTFLFLPLRETKKRWAVQIFRKSTWFGEGW